MHGLTVRWSLEDAPAGTLEILRDYVAESSFPRFATLEGLSFKTWRARDDEWFEGTYVFESAAARERFQAQFSSGAADAPGSRIIGSGPDIEEFEVLAVAEGPAGFTAASRYER